MREKREIKISRDFNYDFLKEFMQHKLINEPIKKEIHKLFEYEMFDQPNIAHYEEKLKAETDAKEIGIRKKFLEVKQRDAYYKLLRIAVNEDLAKQQVKLAEYQDRKNSVLTGDIRLEGEDYMTRENVKDYKHIIKAIDKHRWIPNSVLWKMADIAIDRRRQSLHGDIKFLDLAEKTLFCAPDNSSIESWFEPPQSPEIIQKAIHSWIDVYNNVLSFYDELYEWADSYCKDAVYEEWKATGELPKQSEQNQDSRVAVKPIKFNGTQTDLLELAVALKESGKADATQKEIRERLFELFGMQLNGDENKLLTALTNRKNTKAVFLEKLVAAVNSYAAKKREKRKEK